jgi:hypothetical protein
MLTADTLGPLLFFATALLLLALCSRQLSLSVQEVAYLLFGRSEDMAMVTLFLIFLPGIILHEASHWAMAKLVGLKTGRFRVWPEKKKDRLGLGSVTVQDGGPLRNTLVGMAPLIVGTLVLAWIGGQVLTAGRLGALLTGGDWLDALAVLLRALTTADGLLWAYLCFTVGNIMMPSQSDREPGKQVLVYLLFAALIYLVLGLPLEIFGVLLAAAVPQLQLVTSAFFFTLILDLAVLAMLWLVLQPLRRGSR